MLLTKIQSLGNDFLIVDCYDNTIDNPAEYASKVCDRHFGVGADALVIITYSNDADFRTEIYNVDGVKISPLPNVLVCAAKFAEDAGIVDKTTVSIQTDDGVKYVTRSADNDGYTVNFGLPVVTPQLIPVDFTGELFVDRIISVADDDYIATCVSIAGNPCTVIFTENGEELNNLELTTVAPFIERHNVFPSGTNVIFVNVVDRNQLQARCWCKGNGEVVGCDFGAAAAFMAASLKGLVDEKVCVELFGGDAIIEISDDDFLYITSQPSKVFHIEW